MEEPTADEGPALDPDIDEQEAAPPEAPREIRGLLWIVLPALVGAVLGALIQLARERPPFLQELWGEERTTWTALADGGTVGLLIGGAAGLLLWTFFPYKGAPAPRRRDPAGEP